MLIVYFLGFATGIYMLAPVPEEYAAASAGQGQSYHLPNSQEFVKSFNLGMHKCIDFIKDISIRTGTYVKQKYQERQTSS